MNKLQVRRNDELKKGTIASTPKRNETRDAYTAYNTNPLLASTAVNPDDVPVSRVPTSAVAVGQRMTIRVKKTTSTYCRWWCWKLS